MVGGHRKGYFGPITKMFHSLHLWAGAETIEKDRVCYALWGHFLNLEKYNLARFWHIGCDQLGPSAGYFSRTNDNLERPVTSGGVHDSPYYIWPDLRL